MKLTTGILILGMAAGTAWAQNPDVIENTRNTMKAVVQKKAIDSNAALAASQPQTASAPATTKSQPSSAAKAPAMAATSVKTKPASAKSTAAKKTPAPTVRAVAKPAPAKAKSQAKTQAKTQAKSKPAPAPEVAVKDEKGAKDEKKDDSKPINLTGRRDPFLSPVVNRSMVGSGCSTGKRCLAIDQIALKGVVKSDNGMIAVVVNAVNKAYFLRENDPVFNGYVVKITGDSIVFKETLQDKLGKPFTREVEKKITTPAV